MHNAAIEKEEKENLLFYIPEKKHMEFKTKDDKVLLIFIHKGLMERFLQWLLKKPAISDMELDSIASRAWLCMDGHNTIYDIGRILEKEFGENCEPVYKRLTMFVKYMSAQGLIVINKDKIAGN